MPRRAGTPAAKSSARSVLRHHTKENIKMKNIILGLVAAFALASFATPARAEGEAAGGDAPATAPAKKAKKSHHKKAKKEAPADEAAPAGDEGAKK